MNIHVTSGVGTGPTKLAAFDAALNAAGVANYNLIRLSSIVPPGSKITNGKHPILKQPGKWGDKLYVVMDDVRVDTPNVEAWAGIGWVQDPKTGRGLFVEHEGGSERTVKRDIHQSLKALMATRKVDWGPIHETIAGITCKNEPVCAIAIAVYEATGWKAAKRGLFPRQK